MEATDREIRAPIGFLKIHDGPIQLDYSNLAIGQLDYGINIYLDEPIIMRSSESLAVSIENPEKGINEQLAMVTYIVIKYIEHNRIPGEIVLYYELRTLGWDSRIVCRAYRGHKE